MRRFVTIAVIALAAGLVPGSAAVAGWVTIKNDTDRPVVYREARPPLSLGILRTGKLVKLLPGESHKEFQAKPGTRVIEIYNTLQESDLLLKGPIKWGADDIVFTLTRTPDPAKKLETWALSEVKPLPLVAPGPVQTAGGAAPAPPVSPSPVPASPASLPKPPEKP